VVIWLAWIYTSLISFGDSSPHCLETVKYILAWIYHELYPSAWAKHPRCTRCPWRDDGSVVDLWPKWQDQKSKVARYSHCHHGGHLVSLQDIGVKKGSSRRYAYSLNFAKVLFKLFVLSIIFSCLTLYRTLIARACARSYTRTTLMGSCQENWVLYMP
jgi:hypothetical protein